jgi:outer membrane protein TolC
VGSDIDQALVDARAAEAIALNQYRSGTVNYAVVIQAQNTALSAAQNALSTQRARLVASVSLIEALGGGWR